MKNKVYLQILKDGAFYKAKQAACNGKPTTLTDAAQISEFLSWLYARIADRDASPSLLEDISALKVTNELLKIAEIARTGEFGAINDSRAAFIKRERIIKYLNEFAKEFYLGLEFEIRKTAENPF